MKKATTLFIALLLMATINPVYGAPDATLPTFDNFKMSNTKVTVGDTLLFSLDIKDSESGVSNGAISYRNDAGTWDDLLFLELNPETGLYEGSIVIDEYFWNGTWTVYEIQAVDNASNNRLIKVNHEFEVYGAYEPDKTKPTWKNLAVTNTNVKPGDRVLISVEIYDEQSGPAHGAISFRNSTGTTDDLLFLNLNPETGLYESSILIEKEMQNAKWTIYNLQVSDNEGNNRSEKLSGYSFNVSGGIADITPPTWKNLTISSESVKPGDTIKFSVDLIDSESKPTGAALTVYDPLGREIELVWLKNSAGGNTFTGQWKISLNDIPGLWKIGRIQASDTYGNSTKDAIKNIGFSVKSLFEYGSNTIIKGDEFDSLDNVKAYSTYEGDISSLIQVNGKVNTDSVGFYLIKYEVKGKDNHVYDDYRWIKVINEDNKEQLFNEDVRIEASLANNLSITKDNENYSLKSNGIIDEEGEYKVTFKDSATLYHWNQEVLNNGDSVLLSNSNQRVFGFDFIIDKTPPLVKGVQENESYENTVIQFNEGVAYLNDVQILNDYKVTEPGDYVLAVTDQANNKTEIKFSIKYPLGVVENYSSIKLTSKYALFSWDQIDDATHYEVYRKVVSEKNYQLIDTVSENTYRDDALLADTNYEYSIRAINTSGVDKLSGAMSESINITLSKNYTVYYALIGSASIVGLFYFLQKKKSKQKNQR